MLKNRQTYEIMTPQSIGRTGTDIVLGKHSGRNALTAKLTELGFKLSDEQTAVVFDAVKRLADKKKQIFDEDVVITSYSIHYTKLYDSSAPPGPSMAATSSMVRTS